MALHRPAIARPRSWLSILLTLGLAVWLLPLTPGHVTAQVPTERYLVILDADAPPAAGIGRGAEALGAQDLAPERDTLVGVLERRGATVEQSYPGQDQVAIRADAPVMEAIRSLDGVKAVVPNLTFRSMLDDALPRVRAPASSGDEQLTGKGWAVAIIDTGVERDHPFFAHEDGGSRVVAEACFPGPDNCPNGENGPGAAAPLDSHGTHVAGIATGRRNAAQPRQGVAPDADILAAQVFYRNDADDLVADLGSVRAALQWVYDMRHDHAIAAVNLSLGSDTYEPGACDHLDPLEVLRGPIKDLLNAGILTIAAAGNSSHRTGMSYPACLSDVVAVAASTKSDTFASYTNVSPTTHVIAPGHGITSAITGGTYAQMSGTSMATPMVSGAVAGLREANPTATPLTIRDALSTSYTALDDGRSNGARKDLARLDLDAALARIGVGVTAPLDAPTVSANSGDLEAAISWTKLAAPNGGLVRYRVFRSTGASCSQNSTLVHRGTSTSYADKGLEHDQVYRYCVLAQEGTNNTASLSNTASITARDRTAPPPPKLSAKADGGLVQLTWSKVSDPTTPLRYRLHRSTGSTCSVSSPLIFSGTGRSFTDSTAEPSTRYRYCVTATDGAGNRSDVSNVRSVETTDPLDGCFVLTGDWNRSGRDGIGWWCDGRALLRTSDGHVHSYGYGRGGDVPVAADWNGNGQVTVSVIRDGTWHINNGLRSGAAERTFGYGRVSHGDIPMSGDWDRGGRDLPGIIRDREWHLRAKQAGGPADWRFAYGRLSHGDLPLWGDWNGDGRTTAGIVRKGEWHLRNVHRGGAADLTYTYGRVRAGDVPVVGDWNGDGRSTPGIVRDGVWHLKFTHGGGPADRTINFARP